MFDPITPPLRHWMVRQYHRWLWLHDPFAHNHLLDDFLARAVDTDWVIANGDYSCDTAFVGVADDAAFESTRLCLARLRSRFPDRLRLTIGDHEIGKKMLAADAGGLRLASFRRAQQELSLEPFWQLELGRYVLIGITSTLVALPVFEGEALAGELPEWRELRAQHLDRIRRAFLSLQPAQRVMLFCHDPTALPFLAQDEAIRSRLSQVERTIIGHLHSPAVLKQALRLAGLPAIRFLGHTPLRLSQALREARHWKPFRLALCPSPTGLQLRKDGGYLTVELDPDGLRPVQILFHPLPWRSAR